MLVGDVIVRTKSSTKVISAELIPTRVRIDFFLLLEREKKGLTNFYTNCFLSR